MNRYESERLAISEQERDALLRFRRERQQQLAKVVAEAEQRGAAQALEQAQAVTDRLRRILDEAYREDVGLMTWHRHPELNLSQRHEAWLESETDA